jgi:hypothetical protein
VEALSATITSLPGQVLAITEGRNFSRYLRPFQLRMTIAIIGTITYMVNK